MLTACSPRCSALPKRASGDLSRRLAKLRCSLHRCQDSPTCKWRDWEPIIFGPCWTLEMARLGHLSYCVALLLGLLPLACPTIAVTKLVGSGATTVEKVFGGMIPPLNRKHKVAIRYSPIGSGDGRKQFINGTSQFGSSDVPLSSKEEAQLRGATKLTIPFCLQTISIFVFIPQNTQAIKLTPKLVAQIFSRTITRWDHPAIRSLNPTLKVPKSQRIYVVVRKDSSGTTSLFTGWLDVTARSFWQLGASGSVAWPKNIFYGQGSAGVAATMRASPFSIGYLGTGVGYGLGLTEVFIPNRAKVYRRAAGSDVYAALPKLPPTTASWAGITLLDGRGKQAWPLTSFAYVLSRRNAVAYGASGGLLKAFLNYLNSAAGQALLPRYNFFRLPQKVIAQNLAAVKTISVAKGVKVPF